MSRLSCVHEFEVRAKCPVDNLGDSYQVKVVINRLMKCEDILKICTDIASGDAMYQEQLTEKFAEALVAMVETVGHHRCGVKTTVNYSHKDAFKESE